MNDSQRVLVASLVFAAGVITVRNLQAGTLHPRAYTAFVVVALILMVGSGFSPELAAGFAVLVAAAVFLSGGQVLGSLPVKAKGVKG